MLPKEVVPVVIDEEKTEKHAELKEFRKSFAPTRQDCVAMDYESRKVCILFSKYKNLF